MGKHSLVVGKKILEAIDESQSFKLRIPETAAVKGNGDSAVYSWMETLSVLDSVIKQDDKNPDRLAITVTVKVPADQADSANAGRTFPLWYRVNKTALNAGDKNDNEFKMSVINLAGMKRLATAAGWEITEDSDLLEPFDIPEGGGGEQAPIVGAIVVAKFVDKPGKDRDGNTHNEKGERVRRQDPSSFFHPDQVNG